MAEPPQPSPTGHHPRPALASLPDGALALLLSFLVSPTDILSTNAVCTAWVITGDRVDLWKALGESFEVSMPSSLGRSGAVGGGRAGGGGKRVLRSAANAKRTFFKSYASELAAHRLKHDGTLSEAYTLFRMTDSVAKLKSLLRHKWGAMIPKPKPEAVIAAKGSTRLRTTRHGSADALHVKVGGVERRTGKRRRSDKGGEGAAGAGGAAALLSDRESASPASAQADPADCLWVAGSGRWLFDVNHRHGIYEGNTLLNFAVRCGRRKTVEFIIRQMGADTEAGDDGGFTPLLNAAWRGDANLVQQLYNAGARLDVTGVSRGEGPYSPLAWAERKDRPATAALIRDLMETAAGPSQDDDTGPGPLASGAT